MTFKSSNDVVLCGKVDSPFASVADRAAHALAFRLEALHASQVQRCYLTRRHASVVGFDLGLGLGS